MTLDEAIKEFTDWAKGNRKEQNFWAAERDENDETNPLSYADCEGLARDAETRAEYHEQLAEWLTEYRELKNSIGAVKLKDMKEAVNLLQELSNENDQLALRLGEAIKLLKLALEDFKAVNSNMLTCRYCKHYDVGIDDCGLSDDDSACEDICGWRYADEALKLIGDSHERI